MSKQRLRQAAPALVMAVCLLVLNACGGSEYPNSTFDRNTEFNTAIDELWDRLLFWGTVVFIFVESALVFTIIRFRRRPGGAPARIIHGSAALEIAWTAIPAAILLLIAVPTVRTIFETQAPAPAGAIRVQVIGHQWWWEFRYPDLGITTANELYLPVGRTASFELTTQDVLHAFWIPQMGGKRDLITNKTNYLWFTPDSGLGSMVYNGFCTEYCGTSHANMRIRLYAVQPDEFASWARQQARPGQFPVTPPDSAATGYVFPAADLPDHATPDTPIPAEIGFDDALLGQADPTRGAQAFLIGGCVGCHTIAGNPIAVGTIGPNLTHLASRHTIGAGLFPNDAPTLARWIKNARLMKPGSIMNTIGRGQYDPLLKQTVSGGLTDQQIADVVAYLMALK